jgi:hypothetical protein
MYAECRANVDLYDSPIGIHVPPIDNPEYRVIYWPAWTDSDGSHPERLSVSMGALGSGGTAYHIKPGSGSTVNRGEHAQSQAAELGSGVMYAAEDELPLEDVSEAAMVLGLIKAAHNQRRHTGQ